MAQSDYDRDYEAARQRQLKRGMRPLWLWLKGGRPVLASATRRDLLPKAIYFTREGDPEWWPIAGLAHDGQLPTPPPTPAPIPGESHGCDPIPDPELEREGADPA